MSSQRKRGRLEFILIRERNREFQRLERGRENERMIFETRKREGERE